MKIDIKNIGKVVIPENFIEILSDLSGYVHKTSSDTIKPTKVLKEIKGEKCLVFSDCTRKQIDTLFDYLVSHSDELLNFSKKSNIKSKGYSKNRKKGYDKETEKILYRLCILCENDELKFKEPENFKFLLPICGTPYFQDGVNKIDNETNYYLIPYLYLLKIEETMKSDYQVPELDYPIKVVPNILEPKSSDTTGMIKDALKEIKKPSKILDMGCGSGVLSLMMFEMFDNAVIKYTDILPEAVACATMNFDRQYGTEELLDGKYFTATNKTTRSQSLSPANLYSRIDEKFDLIVFNAPWIVTKARNRSELALNDDGQVTLDKFLDESRGYLEEGGQIILAYSDNSGDEAIENLEKLVSEYGYKIKDCLKRRIQSHQSGRKWMKIFAYILEV